MSAYLQGAVWRWHFYAGICVLPFLLVLALSGLAMLASKPIDRWMHAGLLTVTPSGTPLPMSVVVAAAATSPHTDVATVTVGLGVDRSVPVTMRPAHQGADHGGGHGAPQHVVHVDPYSGMVLGVLDENRTVYAWAKRVHGTLLLGSIGDYLIEIAAGFGVLLTVTGVFLWWPRDRETARRALLPPLAGAGRRRWRSLHAALGAWSAPLLLFFLLSGLAWTPFWGGAMVQPWSSLPGERFAAKLSASTHASLDHDAVRPRVPWALERTPLPMSGSAGDAGLVPIDLEGVIEYARAQGFTQFRVHFPRGEDGVWSVASTTIGGDTHTLGADRIVHLDATTGEMLADIGFADYSAMGKLMAAGVPLHQGDLGVVNLVLNVLFCLAVIGMAVAALTAVWARRPHGARCPVPPPLPPDVRVWRSTIALMLALSVLFPLTALTIAAVLTADLLLTNMRWGGI